MKTPPERLRIAWALRWAEYPELPHAVRISAALFEGDWEGARKEWINSPWLKTSVDNPFSRGVLDTIWRRDAEFSSEGVEDLLPLVDDLLKESEKEG